MSASPYFSIIIVNFQSISQVALLLKTLFSREQEQDLFEVIVVNNDIRESRALHSLASTLPFQIIETKKNIGFGRAANEAIPFIRGQVVGFVNPDTCWQTSFLRLTKDFFENQAIPTIVGVRLVTSEGKEESWSRGLAPTLWRLFCNNTQIYPSLKYQKSVDWVSGGSLFLPKNLFLRLSGFDPDFFLYFEDVDLCIRAQRLGAHIQEAPFGELVHGGGKSFSSQSKQKKEYYRSQQIYFQKHRSKKEYIFVRMFHQFFHEV